MSGCERHGELLGGYVLEALDPMEMEQMRSHVTICPACENEVRRLEALPALLDRIEPADVPPPVPSPEIEEAVLDRFARERPRRAKAERRRTARRGIAAAAALGLLALGLVFALEPKDDPQGPRSYATAKLRRAAGGSDASATAYADAVAAGTRVSLWAKGLDAPKGAVYELWCVKANGRWVSGGTFRARPDGGARAVLTAAVRPGDYHTMVVTRRPDDAREGARGTPVLRGKLRY